MSRQYPSDVCDKALVRFPDGMRDELKMLASASYRSMNAEIISRLRRDIDREKAAPGQP